jgi:hypothetical protein
MPPRNRSEEGRHRFPRRGGEKNATTVSDHIEAFPRKGHRALHVVPGLARRPGGAKNRDPQPDRPRQAIQALPAMLARAPRLGSAGLRQRLEVLIKRFGAKSLTCLPRRRPDPLPQSLGPKPIQDEPAIQ